jgi:hypothetical protein
MKISVFILAASLALAGCKRQLAKEDTEKALESAFYHYLTTQRNYDSTRVKFEVRKVYYFESKTVYDCEFKVNMKMTGGVDTTGVMLAQISKDFSQVKRKD